MTERTALMKEIRTLPDSRVAEVLDFVGYLKQKEEGCPLCARYHEPNETTIAAFEEGDAMLRGEKPARWHHSLDDLDKLLGI